MILFISVLSVVISSFSFLILLIWFFSLCFLMSLANGLSILFIFSKNQLLALLIFAMVSFVSFAFISALVFKIYFLLLTLGFFISSFSSCFRYKGDSFIPGQRTKIPYVSWPKSQNRNDIATNSIMTFKIVHIQKYLSKKKKMLNSLHQVTELLEGIVGT